ncbi:transporter substrate-binding domain-containing protein [Undibacterium sp. TS12]|uniref:transporter substrate-binding domain-containing protein n=1 Tax=Undibacterium sp. TS12 TaxID=2908202 RepID=UPI001F4CD7DF|nr:transporter substrate-binding domain-containing protein [Undibacterium sp. TS12]MCH8621045.1 transporter substrate-binding domain-containing protein [Undibacterium sp. TS12]
MKKFTSLSLTLFTLLPFLCLTLGNTAQASSLEDIKKRGKLIVGVKKDVLLWGYQDAASGKIVGMEPDLAQSIAKDLGVELELVGVLTAERIDVVTSGKVDLLIATLSDTPERQKQLTLVEPHYYSSGVNLLTRKTENFKEWTDLKNRRICSRRGAFYNRRVTVTYGADIVALYSNDWSKQALRDGRCAAFLYDDTSIVAMLRSPEWSNNFVMPMTTIFTIPWSFAIAPAERGGEFDKYLSKTIINWHRSGYLQQVEKNWGIPPSRFLDDMHKLWSKKTGNAWFCGDSISVTTPKECL